METQTQNNHISDDFQIPDDFVQGFSRGTPPDPGCEHLQRMAIYEHVVLFLLNQAEKSSEDGRCAYRSFRLREDGTKKTLACAIGCLIPDKEYSTSLEENTLSALFHENHQDGTRTLEDWCEGILPSWTFKHYALLKNLQMAHDASNTIVELAARLKMLGEVDACEPGQSIQQLNQVLISQASSDQLEKRPRD